MSKGCIREKQIRWENVGNKGEIAHCIICTLSLWLVLLFFRLLSLVVLLVSLATDDSSVGTLFHLYRIHIQPHTRTHVHTHTRSGSLCENADTHIRIVRICICVVIAMLLHTQLASFPAQYIWLGFWAVGSSRMIQLLLSDLIDTVNRSQFDSSRKMFAPGIEKHGSHKLLCLFPQ